jgi:hypothetical protein
MRGLWGPVAHKMHFRLKSCRKIVNLRFLIVGGIAESACGCSAGTNSENLAFRHPAPPGSIVRWAGSRNQLVAAVRARILEIRACDIQPLPNRSFCAIPPILARGHNSRTRSPYPNFRSKSCRKIVNLRSLIVGGIAESACGCSAGTNSGNLAFRYAAPPGSIGCWAGSRN